MPTHAVKLSPKNTAVFASVLLIFTGLFWADNIYVSKIASGHFPPLLLNGLRWMGAGLILTPFAIKPILNDWPEIKQHWLKLCFFSFLSVTVYNSLLYLSAHTTTGINIAVISTLTPLCTFLFSWALYRINPSLNQIIGFGIEIIGVLILIFQGSLSRHRDKLHVP